MFELLSFYCSTTSRMPIAQVRSLIPEVCEGSCDSTFADDLVRELEKQISVPIAYNAIPTRRDPGTSQNATRQADHHGEHPALEQNTMILYVGGESLGLTNLLMTHGLAQVCVIRSRIRLIYNVFRLPGVRLQPGDKNDSVRVHTNEQVAHATLRCCAESKGRGHVGDTGRNSGRWFVPPPFLSSFPPFIWHFRTIYSILPPLDLAPSETDIPCKEEELYDQRRQA
jgi:hypothetical protein